MLNTYNLLTVNSKFDIYTSTFSDKYCALDFNIKNGKDNLMNIY